MVACKTVIHFEDSNVSAPNQDSGSVPEFQMLLSYDVVTKTYRGMMMYGTSRTLVSGTWDDATRTMTFNGMSPDDRSTFVFKHRFLDADHAESTGIQRNAQGEVFMEQTIKQTDAQNNEAIKSSPMFSAMKVLSYKHDYHKHDFRLRIVKSHQTRTQHFSTESTD